MLVCNWTGTGWDRVQIKHPWSGPVSGLYWSVHTRPASSFVCTLHTQRMLGKNVNGAFTNASLLLKEQVGE